jgi:hypothetical protein
MGLIVVGIDLTAHLVAADHLELAAKGSRGALIALRIAYDEVASIGGDDACGKRHGSDRMPPGHVKR